MVPESWWPMVFAGRVAYVPTAILGCVTTCALSFVTGKANFTECHQSVVAEPSSKHTNPDGCVCPGPSLAGPRQAGKAGLQFKQSQGLQVPVHLPGR